MLHQLLVQALVISRLDYCNALLAGLLSSTIKPLQMMQRHKWSSTSPKEPMLHLCLSPCTGCRLWLTLSSRHWCLRIGSAPSYFHSLLRISLQKSEIYEWTTLVVPSQTGSNHFPEHSRSPFLAGGMIFPPLSGMLDPWQFSSDSWKTCPLSSLFDRDVPIYPFFPSRYLGSGYRPIPSTDPIPGCVSGYTAVLLYY